MKTTSMQSGKLSKVSFSDYEMKAIKGVYSKKVSRTSVASYTSFIRSLLKVHGINEMEFVHLSPKDLDALILMFREDQKSNPLFKENTFKASISALNSFSKYMHFKHSGIVNIKPQVKKSGTSKSNNNVTLLALLSKWFGFIGKSLKAY